MTYLDILDGRLRYREGAEVAANRRAARLTESTGEPWTVVWHPETDRHHVVRAAHVHRNTNRNTAA